MELIWKIFGVMLVAGTKFFFSPWASQAAELTYWQAIVVVIIGAWISIFSFFYIGGMIVDVLEKAINWLVGGVRVMLGYDRHRKLKIHTGKNRFIVNVKNRFGIYGLAFLTPCLLSIPVGTVIMAKYFKDNKQTVPVLLASAVLWSFIMNTLVYVFDFEK